MIENYYLELLDREMRWTKSAIECYNLGCNCSKCHLPLLYEELKHHCRMKKVVFELVKKYGIPEEK